MEGRSIFMVESMSRFREDVLNGAQYTQQLSF